MSEHAWTFQFCFIYLNSNDFRMFPVSCQKQKTLRDVRCQSHGSYFNKTLEFLTEQQAFIERTRADFHREKVTGLAVQLVEWKLGLNKREQSGQSWNHESDSMDESTQSLGDTSGGVWEDLVVVEFRAS